ncbi:acyl-CoA N-acyltransferase [Aaosphaeria arxii CBS 175.79]|uniref:Acyl-CoA N-acyltransferase n=1 Tax=Aaosphaeria arxii CBS 175.79 TaxID=1450172 RepID=A0A6A5XM32_9PLEO|nr:acyl-CoA N-acyltransferase [Aaosphaeria arxii CBS 175.79]KAF2014305.1 acyl-CoA N-acyltransferase [Aaosphaeria arxii CBS 175.79]
MSEKTRETDVFYDLRKASFPADLNAVRTLFTEYTSTLGIDLSYQNYQDELANLPGKYDASSSGTIILCFMSPTSNCMSECIVGCAAVRAFPSRPSACELKRFYLVPEARGCGLGRKLLEQVVTDAKALGYKEILLDTLAHMGAARGMYRSFGFEEVEKYYDTPIEGTIFMKLDLEDKSELIESNKNLVA